MNAATIMKLISAKIHFSRNHPRFQAFLKSILSQKIEEGTIIEVTVTRPGEEPDGKFKGDAVRFGDV